MRGDHAMLPEGLTTGTVRGPDRAYPMRGDDAMSTDCDAQAVMLGGYIKFCLWLNK